MDLYSVVVFLHALAAIVVVGGAIFAGIIGARMSKARTVDALRHSLGSLEVISRTIGGSSAVLLLAGVYLGFAGSWWSQAWIVVALVLFLAAGAAASTVLERGLRRMVAAAAELPDGPVTPELSARIMEPIVPFVGSVVLGTYVAILFLMTNKPAGYPAALVFAVVGLLIGFAMALASRRQATAAA